MFYNERLLPTTHFRGRPRGSIGVDDRFLVQVANVDEARDNPWARALSALHTSQRVPLFCPPGSDPRDHAEAILESFAAFHASLREQQRDPTLPLRAWGAPVGVGNHAKGTLDAATSRRAGRGDVPSSFEEFPPLSGKASNREFWRVAVQPERVYNWCVYHILKRGPLNSVQEVSCLLTLLPRNVLYGRHLMVSG